MAWGFESFVYWDPFYWGAEALVMNFIIWTLFAYLSARGASEKPLEEAMQVMGYTFGAGLLMDFIGLPSMWVGIFLLVSYILATKYVVKWTWGKTVFVMGTITVNLGMSTMMPKSVAPIFLWGVVMLMLFIRSQERIRKNKIIAEKKVTEKK
jgi:hypothetical protein